MKKTEKRLQARFGGQVHAQVERGVLVLRGTVSSWEEVVEAGRLAASPQSKWYTVNEITCAAPGEHRAGVQSGCRDTMADCGAAVQGNAQPVNARGPAAEMCLEGLAPDVLIIGAGVVGAAIARELARWELEVVWVEKEYDVALHASSRNDGMVHPGIDLRRSTQKYRYNRRGNELYPALCAGLGVPFKRTGQYLCFRQAWLRPLLYCTLPYWRWLGLSGTRVLGARALHEAEPRASRALRAALFFPSAGVVCPYGLTIALAENAVVNGARLCLETCVTGMETQEGRITAVHTNRGTLRPRVVVNAAGVFSEDVAKMAGDHFFSIHPRRGTNAILDKKARALVRTIYSGMGTTATKTAHSKGGGIVSTVDGNVLVGPDAVETPEKENFETRPESIRATFEKQRAAAPDLRESDIITYFTGVRAATYEEDFVVRQGMFTQNIVHAAGIQSPGLTAAPAIGEEVARLAVALLRRDGPVARNDAFDGRRTPIPHVAALPDEQRAALIAQDPDYGEIVCRCEEVSRGEIRDALHRPVPCATVDGVKRRVRPGMGRCQGGFCGPLVTEIIAREKGVPLEAVRKAGPGSEQLLRPAKRSAGEEGADGAV